MSCITHIIVVVFVVKVAVSVCALADRLIFQAPVDTQVNMYQQWNDTDKKKE